MQVLSIVLIVATFGGPHHLLSRISTLPSNLILSVTGTVATVHGCSDSVNNTFELSTGSPSVAVVVTPGSLYTGDKWGAAASVLSLATNFIATSLIAYKAWCVCLIITAVVELL